MIDNLIEQILKEELSKLNVKENLTGFLVKKKRRGTYQALEESTQIEKEVEDYLTEYIKDWLKTELLDGGLKEKMTKEFQEQLTLELFRRGFVNVIKF